MKLSPGLNYLIEVRAYKGSAVGPISSLNIKTMGEALPSVVNLKSEVLKFSGTTVNITWEEPSYKRKVLLLVYLYFCIFYIWYNCLDLQKIGRSTSKVFYVNWSIVEAVRHLETSLPISQAYFFFILNIEIFILWKS